MFQICVPNQKSSRKKKCYVLETFSKCNDYEHQNTQYSWYYWDFKIYETLINLSKIKKYENVHLSVSYDFSKFDGLKMKVWRS